MRLGVFEREGQRCVCVDGGGKGERKSTFVYGCVKMYGRVRARLFVHEGIGKEKSGYDRPVCCLPRIIAYGLPEANPTGDT